MMHNRHTTFSLSLGGKREKVGGGGGGGGRIDKEIISLNFTSL